MKNIPKKRIFLMLHCLVLLLKNGETLTQSTQAKKINVRAFASMNELTVLSNLESLNSEMIKFGSKKNHRLKLLQNTGKDQLEQLKNLDLVKSVRKEN